MKRKHSLRADYSLHRVRYIIESGYGILANGRYCQRIDAQILETDDFGNPQTIIGGLTAYKLLFDIARNNDLDLLEIADYDANAMIVAEHLYKTDEPDWKEEVEKAFTDLAEASCLILSRIEILPAYRGLGIGLKAIKDLYNNFIQGCSLFALKCFPPQCDPENGITSNYLRIMMNYGAFESDCDKAIKKLKKYFENLGFESIPGLEDEDIMAICPLLKNKKFDAILLE
jgi:hypothetical protein